ncbi:oxygenase MpaB family protein [Microbulbifer pacificus]|uniref:Oxygenase MpaB family protein n=1 Tax=Microbulbifer pacificus TaxID=407164 RepID=A0AAU0MV02_9GAMM|nr:oxygenase MpaB family protein [Microbulbifer pacificus]WOX04004.1 oxygenase MpaB family protein [Microbulbifer pacificus]
MEDVRHAYRTWNKEVRFDFGQPQGEEALVPADSVTWRIFKNPVSMFVGGVTAVILELAEARVRDGVWNNTTFRTDPLGRLRRTGLAAMVTVYGPRSKAEAMIAGIRRMHGNISGITEDGRSYNANDVELLNWVQATASFGFVEAYSQLVKPLSLAEKDDVYREARVPATLYGAVGAPDSVAALDELFEHMRPQLRPTGIIDEFLELMLRTPIFPLPLRPYQRMLVRAAVDILPGWAQQSLQLQTRWRLKNWERRLIRLTGRLADRLVIKASPAVHACQRLGLPENYLYRSARNVQK